MSVIRSRFKRSFFRLLTSRRWPDSVEIRELHASGWGWPDDIAFDLDHEIDLLAYPLAQRLSALAFPEGT